MPLAILVVDTILPVIFPAHKKEGENHRNPVGDIIQKGVSF
jgi:hypothetical protein